MAQKVTFTSNADAILKQFGQVDESLLIQLGELVKGHGQELCPVGDYPASSGRVGGRLKGSIDYVTYPSEGKVVIGTAVEYSGFVEKGTSKMPSQPYLTPAAENNVSAMEQIVADHYRGVGK